MLTILDAYSSFLQSVLASTEGCVPISIAISLVLRDLDPEPC